MNQSIRSLTISSPLVANHQFESHTEHRIQSAVALLLGGSFLNFTLVGPLIIRHLIRS